MSLSSSYRIPAGRLSSAPGILGIGADRGSFRRSIDDQASPASASLRAARRMGRISAKQPGVGIAAYAAAETAGLGFIALAGALWMFI